MTCELCSGYRLELVADMGGAQLVKCGECGHQQIARAQPIRGAQRRQPDDVEQGNAFAGEIGESA